MNDNEKVLDDSDQKKEKKQPKKREGVFQRKDGTWWARLVYTDSQGKRRERVCRAMNKSDARDKREELVRLYKDHGVRILENSHLNFSDLADYFKKNYVIPAEYVDGRKVRGRRSLRGMDAHLAALREHFGKLKLREITYGNIERFRDKKLKTPTKRGKQRTIATVNRELEVLRRMLNIAMREGWIIRNPFNSGDPLISKADECKRERILTRDEEDLLLAACTGPRAHLRAIIICALDTGMRFGEIIGLKWSDVDLEIRIITTRSYKGKTLTERTVGITPRLENELELLSQKQSREPDSLVFGIASNVKRSFQSVRLAAGLPDVRFHDLRHSAATRLVQAHIPLSEVGRILGHSQPVTTYRYVNINRETARRAADALASFNREGESQSEPATIN